MKRLDPLQSLKVISFCLKLSELQVKTPSEFRSNGRVGRRVTTTVAVWWSARTGPQNEINLPLTWLTLLMWAVCSSGIGPHLLSVNRHLVVVEGFACPRDPMSHGVWALPWQPGPCWRARLSVVQEDLPVWRRHPAGSRHWVSWEQDVFHEHGGGVFRPVCSGWFRPVCLCSCPLTHLVGHQQSGRQ